jgi:acyl-CoA synthetase (AMP-forming)/AMP-acid ligase II
MTWIRDRLESFANRIAGIEGDREWTYAEFLKRIDKAAAQLPSGEHQVVEVACEATMDALATLLAIATSRHIALPLPKAIPSAERERMRTVAASSPLYSKLSGSGLILFSSGSSGQPKGMLHNFEALLNRYQNLKARQDRSLLLLLVDHIGGLDSAFRCLFSGSTLVIPEARSPEAAARAIERHRVTVLPASPTFLNLMLLAQLYEKYDLSSVRIVAYGAEAMPASVLQRLVDLFPGAELQQKFGTSETGTIRIKGTGNTNLFFRIDDPDTLWKVVHGELWLKTPSQIIGYIGPEANPLESDDWFRTGDLVECGEDGEIRIVGRIHETINVGGQKVHPHEIAQILESMPNVEAAQVYGENDPITGSRVCAKIYTTSSENPLTWKRFVRSYCRGKLAAWKIPSRVVLCSELEMTTRLKRSDQ